MVAAAERALGPEEGAQKGPLRVSVPDELASGALLGLWGELVAQRPGIDLKIFCEDQQIEIERFSRDLLVRVSHKPPPTAMTLLREVELAVSVVGSPALIDALQSGEPDDHVLLCAPRKTSEVELGIGPDLSLAFKRTLQVSAITTRINLARAGVGVVRCLLPTVADDLACGRLKELAPEHRITGVKAYIGSPHPRPSEATQAIADQIADALADACD
ncbi:MAG: LysR substrate-binding domain-containing protein [Pseudomonadota bacterium]